MGSTKSLESPKLQKKKIAFYQPADNRKSGFKKLIPNPSFR